MAAASWQNRRARLATLLKHPVDDDEDALGIALDRWTDTHRRSNTSGTRAKQAGMDVENTRFGNRDLVVHGTLTKGQFGTIHVVQCRLDRSTYVRKTVAKSAAIRFHQQCSVQSEREILLRARLTRTVWVPHLLCAFQTPTDLNFVMDYEEGGSLEDVLNSAPSGKLDEQDMRWWVSQAVAAIAWCHSQDFVHRDIKPQNFVITATAHLKLIDFGSAAPLQPPDNDGARRVLKKYCLMPCGTVDYIAPEILEAYESALVAYDLDESLIEEEGYGKDVDWWSLGAMMFELLTGQAPFFADDVGQTYAKIMQHEKHSLNLDKAPDLSFAGRDIVKSFLRSYESRLGHKSSDEVKQHPWFDGVQWNVMHIKSPPADLVLPDSSYAAAKPALNVHLDSSQGGNQTSYITSGIGIHFSEFFQSSLGMSTNESNFPETPVVQEQRDNKLSAFIGFSWGPEENAFSAAMASPHHQQSSSPLTPGGGRTSLQVPASSSPFIGGGQVGILKRSKLGHQHRISDPTGSLPTLFTPARPSLADHHFPTTIPRTGTVRRVRPVSDQEAFHQMLLEVGKSARKKVLESGKKPKSHGKGVTPTAVAYAPLPSLHAALNRPAAAEDQDLDQVLMKKQKDPPLPLAIITIKAAAGLGQSTASDSTAPPSPSPRPGSAMSRRSATPGLTTTFKSMTSMLLTPEGTNRSKNARWTEEYSKEGKSASRILSGRSRSHSKSPTPGIAVEPPIPLQARTNNPTTSQTIVEAPSHKPASDAKYDDLEKRMRQTLAHILEMEERLKGVLY